MDPGVAALREAARRILRTEGVILEVPPGFGEAARALSLRISDELPKLIREPTIVEAGPLIRCSGLFQLGGDAPDLETCWVPGADIAGLWADFSREVTRLLIAGYPGCVGCAGKDAEQPWDEVANRRF